MPGGFPLGPEICNGNNAGASTSASYPTVMTTGGSNTKGSWVQLTASTPSDTVMMLLTLIVETTSVGAPQTVAFDIGIGGSGSEVAVVNNILMNSSEFSIGTQNYLFPLSIKAGTRVAVRAQGSSASMSSVYAQVILFDGAMTNVEGAAGVDAIGFNSATTLGTAVTPNASSNTKGTYAQLTASTSRDYAGIMAAFDIQGSGNAAPYLVDIAIGGSGSEQIILPNYALRTYNTQHSYGPFAIDFLPIPIPAGTRIAARSQAATGSGSAIGLTLYGVYQ